MLQLGRFNNLTINRLSPHGLYVGDGKTELLLPNKYVPESYELGDYIDVFVFKDSEDRLTATTLEPYAQVGEFAFLEAKDLNSSGAFLDWGLEKDLFVPFKEQNDRMAKGRAYIVYLYVDSVTERIVATSKINKFTENHLTIDVKEGDTVDIMIYKYTDLGVKVIANNKYWGMLFLNEIFKNLRIGEKMTAIVKKIREDGKLDLTLQQNGMAIVSEIQTLILEKLEENDGFLPYNDNSSPEDIYRYFNVSKKVFKKTIGTLFKEKKITLADSGIHLVR
jgi:predicted RNA-binding protein (virulence factor B family)